MVVRAVVSPASVVLSKKQTGTVVSTWPMSVPTIKAEIDASRQFIIEKHMNVDMVAALNCISQVAYKRDFAWLEGIVRILAKLTPSSLAWHFDQGALCHRHYDTRCRLTHWLLSILQGLCSGARCSALLSTYCTLYICICGTIERPMQDWLPKVSSQQGHPCLPEGPHVFLGHPLYTEGPASRKI